METHVDAVDRTNTVIKRRKGDASDTTEIHKEEVAGLGRESRCHGGADCKAFPLPARRLSCTHACGVHEQGAPAGAHDVQHLRRKGLRQVSVFSQQAEGPQICFLTAALGPSLRRLQGASREPAAELRAEERGARGHELAQAVGRGSGPCDFAPDTSRHQSFHCRPQEMKYALMSGNHAVLPASRSGSLHIPSAEVLA